MNRTVWPILMLLAALAAAATAYAREDHRPYAALKLSDCAECHLGSGVPPNHGGGWLQGHRILAANPNRNCYDCHDQSTCQNCHKGGGMDASASRREWKRDVAPESHRTDWISIHPIQARSTPQQCTRCHEPRFCQDCHSQQKKADLTIFSHRKTATGQSYIVTNPDAHAAEARRNLASCQACHPDADVCLPCHSARSGLRINPHPPGFKAGNIQSRTGNRTCRVCHDF
jgi:hypothetical protein